MRGGTGVCVWIARERVVSGAVLQVLQGRLWEKSSEKREKGVKRRVKMNGSELEIGVFEPFLLSGGVGIHVF
jgi:hypothetical protein